MSERFSAGLAALVTMHAAVRALHPALQSLQPVAVAEGERLFVYEATPQGSYVLALETAVPMPIPPGVRAAFPLEAYGDRMACVVSGDVFDEATGPVTLFHEFVHCYQANTCEIRLKQNLGIARQAMQKGDFMWEIDYPFPYTDRVFADAYTAQFRAADSHDLRAMQQARLHLRTHLMPEAWEYLHWQEWKEGLARYLENCMRRQLGLAENLHGCQQPYDRVSFYAGGAAWIAALASQDASFLLDIEVLFQRMGQTPIELPGLV